MAQKGEIAIKNLTEAVDRLTSIHAVRGLAVQNATAQIKALVPFIDQAGPLAANIADKIVTAEMERLAANQTLGGINLSDENLTMNIKLDGKGMPLPAQYQDKAMMNLNGLTSIIRSITPLTRENVPALYELLK